KRRSFLHSTTGFQRLSFFGEPNRQTADSGKIGCQLLAQMRDINDDFFDSIRSELIQGIFNHRFARDGNQRLRDSVGQWFQARAVTGGENHCFGELTLHAFQSSASRQTGRGGPRLSAGASARVGNEAACTRACARTGSSVRKWPTRAYVAT